MHDKELISSVQASQLKSTMSWTVHERMFKRQNALNLTFKQSICFQSFNSDSTDFHFFQLYHKHGQISSNLAACASTNFIVRFILWCFPESVKHNAMPWWHPAPLVNVVHFANFMNRFCPFCPSRALPEWSQDNESLVQPPTTVNFLMKADLVEFCHNNHNRSFVGVIQFLKVALKPVLNVIIKAGVALCLQQDNII